MPGTTTIYGLVNGEAAGNTFASADLNLMNTTAEFFYVNIAELPGNGIFLATDFNGTIVGGALTVQVSSGRGFIGNSGSCKLVYNVGAVNVTGLAATKDNYIYLHQDGTFTSLNVTIGAGAPATPANTHLVCMATTSASQATAINNLPTGRNNIAFFVLGGNNSATGNNTFTGQNTFNNATAPIIIAKIGPTNAQQHTLPAVASDTIVLLAPNQTFTGQNTFSNASAPIIVAKVGPTNAQQHTLPAVASDTIVLLAASQTLTTKTLTAPVIQGTVGAGTGLTMPALTQAGTITFTSGNLLMAGGEIRSIKPSMRKQTITAVAPSATLNTFGTATTMLPTTGYLGLRDFVYIGLISQGTFGAETLSVRCTVTYDNATTAQITKTFTTTGAETGFTDAEMFSLYNNQHYITQIAIDAESTINSSTATGGAKIACMDS